MSLAASPAAEFQKRVYEVLCADAHVMAVVTAIYDNVPQASKVVSVTKPYISFGPMTETPIDAVGITYSEYRFQIDIWSDKREREECQNITWLVKRAFHNQCFDLPTHAIGTIRATTLPMTRDPNGITNHGMVMLTTLIEER